MTRRIFSVHSLSLFGLEENSATSSTLSLCSAHLCIYLYNEKTTEMQKKQNKIKKLKKITSSSYHHHCHSLNINEEQNDLFAHLLSKPIVP